eukprot:jgi/Ulvmu1/10464/UM064_0001.1
MREEWLEHGLGDASSIKATVEKAAGRHGEEAMARLKDEANKLFTVGSSSAVPVKSAQKLEEAVLKRPAALWLHLDKSREGSAYAARSIIDTRFRFWGEAAGTIEPPALHYMDLAALAIMRAGHVSVTSLRANVYRGRCQAGDWKDMLTQALDAGLASVDVMA